MDFELDDDQLALRDAAGELLAGFASSTQVRVVVEAGGGVDHELWAAMLAQGWTGIGVPEAAGGLGLGWVELAVLLEQVGARVAPAPILQQVVALEVLVRAGSTLVPAVMSGDTVATVAFTPVHARESGGQWFLDGTTEPAVYAPSARLAIVRTDDAVFGVDLDGVQPVAEAAMDRTRQVGWLRFDGTPATRLGGRDLAELFVDVGAVAYAAELLGHRWFGARPRRVVRERTRAVRPTDRQLPGGEASLRRHARRRRGHALGRLLRRVVHRGRRP